MPGTGKLMIFTAWIGAAALLTWLFTGTLERRDNPNQRVETLRSGETVEVRLVRNAMGHYVATGRINGRSVRFFLDTGATHVALGGDLARELGLERGGAGRTQTANGTIVTYRTVLDRVELGGIRLTNVTAAINPAMSGDEVLLGMSFMQHLEMVQRGDRLLLRQTAPPGHSS
ncbi:MAG TPA: TIGR02281 family clan AA aspartic protease [Arenicellales bacterium]|nr:TIGR02281 family clan AA aspartic protease [Arenicellales bacterium]